MNLPAAERTIANAITHQLRHPWHIHTFDYRGNLAPMTSPFRLTARPPAKPPSVFVERYVWGTTDPDGILRVPPFVWMLTEHRMLRALARFPLPQQATWREYLNAPGHPNAALPFRRHKNRHGTLLMRRTEDTPADAAHVAVALAHAATVTIIDEPTYRETFPLDLCESSQGVPPQDRIISTVHACP